MGCLGFRNTSFNYRKIQVVEKRQRVKQLQEEVARLEAELRSPGPSSSSCDIRSLLKEKDLKIQQVLL